MATITPDQLRLIFPTQLPDDTVSAFINSANILVTSKLGSKGVSDDVMEQITLWLTAHMMATTVQRQAHSLEASGAKIVYEGVTGEGLKSTTYGQMVLDLDPTDEFLNSTRTSALFFAIPDLI